MAGPWLSVVVPARDAAGSLARCLGSWAAAGGRGVEVVVVDDGSRDHTLAEARRLGRELPLAVRVLSQPRLGPGAARNLGLGQAWGEVVLFSDPGSAAPPHLPARLRELFSQPDLAGAGGGLRPAAADSPVARLMALELAFDTTSPVEEPDACPLMSCAAFRREAVLAAGGCDESLGGFGARDRELCSRLAAAGGRLVFDPELWVVAELPATWRQAWAAETARGRRRYQDLRQGRSLPPGSHLQPALVILAAGFLVALWPQDPVRAGTLALLALLLLYPTNHRFLKFVVGSEPGLVRHALAMCLWRPAAWTAGMLSAAAARLGAGR
jgi:cellulose synthase/poly-beta-1,6-N-acetylglucosamine synthase-like glycosyltransferase